MNFLGWIENLAPSVWVRESSWGFPIVQTLHAIGMALLVGTITIVNLRLLGAFKRIPAGLLMHLLVLIWVGFAVNACSGLLMFMADASRLSFNPMFQIKIVLIAAGFVIALGLRRVVFRSIASWANGGAIPRSAMLLSCASLLVWYGAVVAGRLTAFQI